MKEGFQAGAACAASGPIIRIEVFLAETVFAALEYERIRFYLPAAPIVCDIHYGQVVRGFHDEVAEMGRIKGNLPVTIHADAGKEGFYVFLEENERSIEVKEALRGAYQVFMPNRAERFQGKI